MDTIRDDGSIKCKSSSKVDLKGLSLNRFIKNSTKIQFLKCDLENLWGPYQHEIANLRFEKVIDT